MDVIQSRADIGGGKTFFTHVFNTSDDANAEILNASQYALLAVIPVVILNKLVQKFVPEADPDKSSMELLVEVILQILVMFVGIIFIHRIITYVPTYSSYKYDHMVLTHVILAFLVIVLSLQTKLGIKVNILVDRVSDLWNGTTGGDDKKQGVRNRVRFNEGFSEHASSQADYLDAPGAASSTFPPAPRSTSGSSSGTSSGSYDMMMRGSPPSGGGGPMAANSVLGGAFGSLF
jgi:hypothetical protein